MEKIVALNSGGFDSIVMLHWLREQNPEAELDTLFFNYGQTAKNSEMQCALRYGINDQNCFLKKVDIELPCKVTMTKEDQYIPSRNLVFLSYAISYAESIGAKKIYIALIDNQLSEDDVFFDCSEQFIMNLNTLINPLGITIETPFLHETKEDLYPLINKYDIKRYEVHTCNVSDSGCGECNDCKKVDMLFQDAEKHNPMLDWYRRPDVRDPQFIADYMEEPITEVRVHSNHKCQLHCEHCYYGDYALHGEELTHEQMWNRMFVPAIQYGVQNFHFSGKEPLYGDGAIFEYGKRLKSYNELNGTHVTYDLITNGINLPKYADTLKELGFSRICVSVDGVHKGVNGTEISGVSPEALKCAVSTGLKVEVFICITNGNYDKLGQILRTLHDDFGVKHFFFKTIIDIGHGGNVEEVRPDDLSTAFDSIAEFCEDNRDSNVIFNITHNYIAPILKNGAVTKLEVNILRCREYESWYYKPNLKLDPEFMCYRYYNQMTVTPDGEMLGCASEVSTRDYKKKSAGNVLYNSFDSLVESGKRTYLENIRTKYCKVGDKCYVCDKCTF